MFCRERVKRVHEPYKAFVKTKPCIFCGHPPGDAFNPVDPHHVIPRRWREVSRDDLAEVPACRRCHNRVGNIGIMRTLERAGMKPTDLAIAMVDLLGEFFLGAQSQQDHVAL